MHKMKQNLPAHVQFYILSFLIQRPLGFFFFLGRLSWVCLHITNTVLWHYSESLRLFLNLLVTDSVKIKLVA